MKDEAVVVHDRRMVVIDHRGNAFVVEARFVGSRPPPPEQVALYLEQMLRCWRTEVFDPAVFVNRRCVN